MNGDEPMEMKKDKPTGPPSPRLVPGSLVNGEIEITGLYYADGRKNVYRATGEGRALLVLELGDSPGELKLPEAEGLLPQDIGFFQQDNRTYLVFAQPEGDRMAGLVFPCIEMQLIKAISGLIKLMHDLDGEGIDVEKLGPEDMLFGHKRPAAVIFPTACRDERETGLKRACRRLVKHFLYKNVEPRITRNLERPLECLGLSYELTEILTAYLAEEVAVDELNRYLHLRKTAPEAVWRAAFKTHVGLVRDHNEDACGYLSTGVNTDRAHYHCHLLAVADGMGGHHKGEVAAYQAFSGWLTGMGTHLLPLSDPDFSNPKLLQRMSLIMERTARAIYNQGNHQGEGPKSAFPPGSTLVAGLLSERLLFLGNCGDSRAYRLQDGRLERITRDHSLVQMFVDRGQITEDEARDHSQSNVITSFMGIDPRSFKNDFYITWLKPGARLLLCSDGITDMLDDNNIQNILTRADDPYNACNALIEAALAAGGRDNISAVVAFDACPQPVKDSE
ncbi:MAG: protein phosphatase 2C domain-containing protein [Acidobacteriota bacterium]|nr:protein phosphatase 2C domain-containing protein [Acidobacteriota bacterium]